jgi:hypothetical protein
MSQRDGSLAACDEGRPSRNGVAKGSIAVAMGALPFRRARSAPLQAKLFCPPRRSRTAIGQIANCHADR